MAFDNHYTFSTDVRLVREMLALSQENLGKELKVNASTISRWERGTLEASVQTLETFYEYAYAHGIYLNQIKEQFYREDLENPETRLLFHGAKDFINGPVKHNVSRDNNDFGKGFYCGESLQQSALFVANFQNACVYMLTFCPEGLHGYTFQVDRDWMLTIAWFRGRLDRYKNEPSLHQLLARLSGIDYIIAPIADNQMYRIIDEYIAGEITDEQCRHALAATDLGMQYVMKSKAAAERVILKERCYLCASEREEYQNIRRKSRQASADIVKAARIRYRGQGKYIDEGFAS